MSLVQNTVSTAVSEVLPVFQNLKYKLQRRLSDMLPNQQRKSSKVIQMVFWLLEGYTKTSYCMRHCTGANDTDQCQNSSSNLLSPYREQPRSAWNVVAYPRPAFSAKRRTNHAPISVDQQAAQVSQGHASYRNKKIEIPSSMVVETLIELMKPAREPASSHPKPRASLKKTHES